MFFSKWDWWCGTVGALLLFTVGGCDVPTGEPSIHTDVALDAPLVAEKTLTFLGGPNSKFEPLVDTTTSEFDSLFVVSEETKDVSIRQKIDDFEIGSLDDALDEASGDLSITNSNFETNLIESSEDLAAQQIDAAYTKENEPYQSSDPDGSLGTTGTVFDDDGDDEIVVPFPAPRTDAADVFELPDFGSVDATNSGATVDSVRLTDDRTAEGVPVNQIQFTLTNNSGAPLEGKGGTGTPSVQIQDTEGAIETLETANFDAPIAPGDEATTTLFVTGLVLDESTRYKLLVSGTSSSGRAELNVDLSAWRYQTAYLSNAGDVRIEVSQDNLATKGPEASRFEGIDVGQGSVTLGIDNQLSFDLTVGEIRLRNANEPPFGDINNLDVGKSFENPPIRRGTDTTQTVGMGGRGISDQIDVSVTASPASSQIAVSATDSLGVSTAGTIRIQTLYFRPNGENVRSSGTFSFDEERATFKEGDYVEVSSVVLDVDDLVLEPDARFRTFSLVYPDLRRRDADGDGRTYEVDDDAFRVRFVENPSGKFEFSRDKLTQSSTDFQVSFDDANVRIFPPGRNVLDYKVLGQLEKDRDAEAIVSIDDEITGKTSIENLSVQELDVSGVEPFSIEVTPNEDADGELDVAENEEVRKASFEGFSGITGRVDGLQLASTSLDFVIETRNLTGTTAQLHTAIQGRSQSERVFLAGKPGTDRGVSSVLFETEFVEGGEAITPDSLLQLEVGVENAELGERIQQQKTVDDANSNVTSFINALPTQVRFVGQARVNENGGDLKLRRPVEVDAGFSVEVPLQIKGAFVVRDTIDADFSSLKDVTDPTRDLSVSGVTFQFGYENGLPLGADVEMTIANGSGEPIRTFSGDELRIEPAPKNAEGAAEGTTGKQTATLNLGSDREQLRALAEGEEIQLRLTMDQNPGGAAAQLRADDTIQFDLQFDVDASLNTAN